MTTALITRRPPRASGLPVMRSLIGTDHPVTDAIDRLAQTHPRIAYFRGGPEHIHLLTHPDTILAVYRDHGKETMKGRGLQSVKDVVGEGLLTSEGDLHLRQRRLMSPAFRRDQVNSYGTDMVDCTVEHLAGWSDRQHLNLVSDMSALTLDIAGRTLFGADLGSVQSVVSESLNTLLDGFRARLLPWGEVWQKVPTPQNKRMTAANDQLDKVVRSIIAERRRSIAAGGEPRNDLLDLLVRASEDGLGMSDDQLRDESLTLMMAGHETTAMLLSWTWYLLSCNPAQADQLRAELRDVVGDRYPTVADYGSLTYTRAVLHETLRLFPPAFILGRKLLSPVEVDEWVLPAGDSVMVSQWVTHRDPRWWDSARSFRPERWINDGGEFDESAPGQPKGAWFPFGWGNRTCIGDRFALLEGALVLATIAARWEVIPDAGVPADVLPAVTLRPKYGIPSTVRRIGE